LINIGLIEQIGMIVVALIVRLSVNDLTTCLATIYNLVAIVNLVIMVDYDLAIIFGYHQFLV